MVSRISFFLVLILMASLTHGQKKKGLEIDIIGRYDRHADYTTRYFSRSYANDTKLWGKSFGVHFKYFQTFYKKINFNIGIGYYNLGVDKIRQTTPFGIIAKGRNIDYRHPSGILLLFSTEKYHYDNLDLSIGLDYNKPFQKKLDLVIGSDFSYLFTFSQLYHIPYDDIRYRTNNSHTLGIQINSHIGVLINSENGRYYVSPRLIMPIYQTLHGDEIFGEDDQVRIRKWLHGIGLSVVLGRTLE